MVHGGGGRGWRAAPGVRQRAPWRAAVDDGGRRDWRWRDPDGLAGPVMVSAGLSWVFLFFIFLFD